MFHMKYFRVDCMKVESNRNVCRFANMNLRRRGEHVYGYDKRHKEDQRKIG
ncbi:hypothetical protein GCM10007176_01970 [Salinicoccus roseus]|nr:hypothetical protein GCM10007176_01970 [Salinicoccus roseus]